MSRYLNCSTHWLFFLQDFPHYSINTNNYIESWHHHLKTYYLKLMRRQRIDVIIHILTEKVEPDFRRSELRVTMGFEAPRLSKEERENRSRAEAIESAMMGELVDTYNDTDANEVSYLALQCSFFSRELIINLIGIYIRQVIHRRYYQIQSHCL